MVTSCPHSLYFFRGNVEENFDLSRAMNTFRDWHIVPLGRPTIQPPQQKKSIVDIPGANGVIDLSNSLTKYPVFNNRTGSLNFAVLNDIGNWLDTYTKILKYLQGNPIKMIMEDDPTHYYEGSFYIENWNSRSDGTWSELSIGYDVYPYRLSINMSTEDDWLWDPFNFETDIITDTVFNAIRVDTTSSTWKVCDFTGLIDMMPVIPEFTVDTDDDQPMTAQVYNSDLSASWKTYTLPEGTYKINDLILCESTPESIVKMRFRGHGQVSIKFRSGRL